MVTRSRGLGACASLRLYYSNLSTKSVSLHIITDESLFAGLVSNILGWHGHRRLSPPDGRLILE